MRTDLTPQQIAEYRERGFVAVRGFLTPDEVHLLKAAVLDAIATMGRRKVAGDGAALQEGDSYYDRVFTQRLNLWRISGPVRQCLLAPRLGAMLGALTGAPGIRVWHDQALIKEPFGNPTAWHLDNPYWSFSSRDSVSIWIALEDATLENGCMWFVPGTHHLAELGRNVGIGPNVGDLFRVYPQMAQADPVPVPMKAGDCSFHNGLTAHGAGANMTRGRRIAMTCAYMPTGSVFNGQQNILPDAYFRTLRVGDPLTDDQWNPLIWGVEPPAAPR